jgi:hypothetical protein
MDESLQDLENELGNLRPRRPSSALEARVAAELAEVTGGNRAPGRAGPSGRRIWFGWSLAAVAALVLFVAMAEWRAPARPPSAPAVARTNAVAPPVSASAPASLAAGRYRPAVAASVLYDLKDDGEVYLSGDTPVRRLRYRYVDTYTWRNPATNASLKWSVPREEIRVLPASLH